MGFSDLTSNRAPIIRRIGLRSCQPRSFLIPHTWCEAQILEAERGDLMDPLRELGAVYSWCMEDLQLS